MKTQISCLFELNHLALTTEENNTGFPFLYIKFFIMMRIYLSTMGSLTVDYMQRKRKSRKGGSHSTLSMLRRELREGNLQSLFGGSSCIVSSNSAAPDPLLSSFILPMAEDYGSHQSHSSTETVTVKKSSSEVTAERYCLHF